jgi:hypothetical protein
VRKAWRKLVAVDREDRRAEVPEDGVQRLVGRDLREPGFGRELLVGKLAPPGAPERIEETRPCLVTPFTSSPHPPFERSTSRPLMRKSVAGDGIRRSHGAPTRRNVSSMTPPYSIAMAPVFTLNPSTSTVDARPPTRSRDSTTTTFRP